MRTSNWYGTNQFPVYLPRAHLAVRNNLITSASPAGATTAATFPSTKSSGPTPMATTLEPQRHRGLQRMATRARRGSEDNLNAGWRREKSSRQLAGEFPESTQGGNRERPHSGVGLISIQMVRAVAYLFFVGKLSNPPNLVRLRADRRHVAD
jgi:hypothetical protein